ncbi:hypothetical protein I7I51_03682 [Histoplasma capsulatum]|uniref:Uncharacterized protein n=1 Tax=Ajellomyces capsulatus TaxID=5037 RepID=A0A8A1MBH3_AJECA|nr:hypothetical protein I7I51_03682 [Histoplasma capsulatum]
MQRSELKVAGSASPLSQRQEPGSARDNAFNTSLSPRGKLITVRLCWPQDRPCKRVIDLKAPDDEYNYLEDHIADNGFDSNNVGPIIQLGEGQYDIGVASSAEAKFDFVYSHTRAVHFGINDRLAHLRSGCAAQKNPLQ